jgi:predicted phosphodiesterase
MIDGDILLCHGTPTSDLIPLLEQEDRLASPSQIASRLGETEAALILCGHSHVPRSVRSGGRLIVNPGSVGLPAYAEDRPFPYAIQTGSPDARYAIVERRSGVWSANLISVPYAADRAVAAARARGRTDWATALATGYAA